MAYGAGGRPNRLAKKIKGKKKPPRTTRGGPEPKTTRGGGSPKAKGRRMRRGG